MTGNVSDPTAVLVPMSSIVKMAGCSRSHVNNLVRRGQFPPPAVRLGPRFTRWRAADVAAYLADPQGWIDAARGAVSTLAGSAR